MNQVVTSLDMETFLESAGWPWMKDSSAQSPRPAQGRARPLVWPLAGVVAGLIVYIAKLWIAPAAAPDDAVTFVLGGAIIGLAMYFLFGRRSSKSDAIR